MKEIRLLDNHPVYGKNRYTWRDYAMTLYFILQIILGIINLNTGIPMYNIATIVIGSIGVASTILKYKRVESVVITMIGLLLFSRGILLVPMDMAVDNHNILDILRDTLAYRPLADGLIAILPLSVLALYRGRRGRFTR